MLAKWLINHLMCGICVETMHLTPKKQQLLQRDHDYDDK